MRGKFDEEASKNVRYEGLAVQECPSVMGKINPEGLLGELKGGQGYSANRAAVVASVINLVVNIPG